MSESFFKNWDIAPFYCKACIISMNLASITINERHYKEMKYESERCFEE